MGPENISCEEIKEKGRYYIYSAVSAISPRKARLRILHPRTNYLYTYKD